MAFAFATSLASPSALAQVDTDAIADLLAQPGSAGLGFLYRFEQSPYRDAGLRSDLLVHLGRPFIERLNGWPLDFHGYIGLLYRNERNDIPTSSRTPGRSTPT